MKSSLAINVAERMFQWVLAAGFFAAQAFVATGGIQAYFRS